MKKLFLLLVAVLFLAGCAVNDSKPETEHMDTTDSIVSTDTEESSVTENSESLETDIRDTEQTSGISDTIETNTPDTQQPDNALVGKYLATSKFFEQDSFVNYPEYITWIKFENDNKCIFHIYYIGGVHDTNGTYEIDGETVKVKLDLTGTPFDGGTYYQQEYIPYMDDEYYFRIVDNDHIVIGPAPGSYDGGDCYVVDSGDTFVRQY